MADLNNALPGLILCVIIALLLMCLDLKWLKQKWDELLSHNSTKGTMPNALITFNMNGFVSHFWPALMIVGLLMMCDAYHDSFTFKTCLSHITAFFLLFMIVHHSEMIEEIRRKVWDWQPVRYVSDWYPVPK